MTGRQGGMPSWQRWRYAEVAEPADLRQVRLTLSLLGSRLGAPVLAQRRASSREATLRAWEPAPFRSDARSSS